MANIFKLIRHWFGLNDADIQIPKANTTLYADKKYEYVDPSEVVSILYTLEVNLPSVGILLNKCNIVVNKNLDNKTLEITFLEAERMSPSITSMGNIKPLLDAIKDYLDGAYDSREYEIEVVFIHSMF